MGANQGKKKSQKKGNAGAAATAAEKAGSSGQTPKVAYENEYKNAGTDVLVKMTVDDFELLKVVGRGSFGKVYQVKEKSTGDVYAMKVLKKQQLLKRKQVEHTQTERKVLQSIDSPFVVSMKYAFQTKDKLYMILEYFTGGELFYHLKSGGRFGYKRARFYAAEITLALEALHGAGIIYRDLKPENLLLDDQGHIRLTDFGLSKDCIIGNQETATFCGTPEYLAPEVIVGNKYNKAVDWWSFGTVTYEMMCGLPPFYSKNIKAMYQKILSDKLRFPKGVPAAAQEFFIGLLDRNPKTRLGSKDGAAEVKRSAFFQGIDWTLLNEKKIEPPFKPTTKGGKMDTTNVDPEFLKEQAQESLMPVSQLAGSQAEKSFPGFTYDENESTGALR